MRSLARLLIVGLLALVAACGQGEAAVEQAVLFSAIEGQVLKAATPLAGAVLIREWDFAENQVRGRDETTTDANGHFRFPAVTHPYKKPRLLAQEPIVAQLIRVQSGGTEWRVWAASKHDLKAGTESSTAPSAGSRPEMPLRITIDLDSPRALRGQVVGHTLFAGTP